jgi:type I restriction enzyme R subunit
LEDGLQTTEIFLQDEVDFDLQELIAAPNNLQKLSALHKAINAVYTNDETKRKFQVLARAVFQKFKALQPHKVLYQYEKRKNAIDAIYSAIEDNIESADVSEIMLKIQNVVDESIETMAAERSFNEATTIDLSGLNFDLLEQYFTKTKNKNTVVQSLKSQVEKRLKQMVERNPLTIDYYKRYQEIIDEYNRGKDEVVIKETFRKLIELVNSYSEEEADTKREGLTDEQKAIFDILRRGKQLSKEEKNEVKRISVELLAELKKEKLQVVQWSEKYTTAAAVERYVNDILFKFLPYEKYQIDDINLRSNLVYEHLKQQYYGGGLSVYGRY